MKQIEETSNDPELLAELAKQIPPSIEESELVPCPYCNRKFNPTTAERHIPKCKDTVHRPKPPPNFHEMKKKGSPPRSPPRG